MNIIYQSTKIIELGSCAFKQPRADSHCKFIHGYRLSAKFTFACNELDQNHWVVDFGGLKGLKQKLEKQFDHTTCIAADDPDLDLFKQMHERGVCDLRIMPNGTGIERISEWCLKVADEYVKKSTNGRCSCLTVEVWEHEKNSAISTNAESLIDTGHQIIDNGSVNKILNKTLENVDKLLAGAVLDEDPGQVSEVKTEVYKSLNNQDGQLIKSFPDQEITHPSGDPHQTKSSNNWNILE